MSNTVKKLRAKDFASDQEIRWCPGCGDFQILRQVQNVMPELGIPKDDIVFVSGIGCSSRFPYYMNTYGMHSIHGRATIIASGLKISNPNLSVWVVTGDGDSLSIGGNHLIHLFRRNIDVNVLLFNNEIYGLTKGQFSPTSKKQIKTKSSPFGSLDNPFNPVALALGSGATFVARAMDRNGRHLKEMLLESNQHKGTSFLEIYQNCHIFNDKAFEKFSDREKAKLNTLYLEANQPLVFNDGKLGIKLEGLKPVVVNLEEGATVNDLMVHEPNNKQKAQIISTFFELPNFPRVFGVIYRNEQENNYNQSLKAVEFSYIKQQVASKNTWQV